MILAEAIFGFGSECHGRDGHSQERTVVEADLDVLVLVEHLLAHHVLVFEVDELGLGLVVGDIGDRPDRLLDDPKL